INKSILSPKATMIGSLLIMVYSGILLSIFNSIDFVEENGAILAFSILALIFVSSVSITALTNYVHYINYTKPLLRLARAAKEVSEGNYKIQLPPHRTDGKTDEIDALYQDFNAMVRNLDSTEILKSSFISNISHELKTPIAIISNYATLLAEDKLNESERQDYIEKIKTASSDLSDLIANILQISRLDNDQVTANMAEMDISELMIQCILGFETILDEKDIDLQLDIPDNIMIISDQGLLKIVINNIISNALKFTPVSGTVKISLSQDREYATLVFEDSGCGMDKDTMDHIFDKFYQGDTSHSVKGNGLGLAMVKQIVTLLKGTITVESTPDVGSTFTVKIPD
ncbi:MAG: HAMP domain-containing histidine kinase, partial [Lachnospiraceae bacterium]|nr:HAMP domain-containing histidine kinase [Lachnospiraceae bacterium]